VKYIRSHDGKSAIRRKKKSQSIMYLNRIAPYSLCSRVLIVKGEGPKEKGIPSPVSTCSPSAPPSLPYLNAAWSVDPETFLDCPKHA